MENTSSITRYNFSMTPEFDESDCIPINELPLYETEDSDTTKQVTEPVIVHNQKNDDCYFYYYSSCTKGSQCSYRHEPAALCNETMCRYWLQGNCSNRHCIFRHMEIAQPRNKIPCFFEKQPGGCKKVHCAFLHNNVLDQPREQDKARNPNLILPVTGDSPGPESSSCNILQQQQQPAVQRSLSQSPEPVLQPTLVVYPAVLPVVISMDDAESGDSDCDSPSMQFTSQPQDPTRTLEKQEELLKLRQIHKEQADLIGYEFDDEDEHRDQRLGWDSGEDQPEQFIDEIEEFEMEEEEEAKESSSPQLNGSGGGVSQISTVVSTRLDNSLTAELCHPPIQSVTCNFSPIHTASTSGPGSLRDARHYAHRSSSRGERGSRSDYGTTASRSRCDGTSSRGDRDSSSRGDRVTSSRGYSSSRSDQNSSSRGDHDSSSRSDRVIRCRGYSSSKNDCNIGSRGGRGTIGFSETDTQQSRKRLRRGGLAGALLADSLRRNSSSDGASPSSVHGQPNAKSSSVGRVAERMDFSSVTPPPNCLSTYSVPSSGLNHSGGDKIEKRLGFRETIRSYSSYDREMSHSTSDRLSGSRSGHVLSSAPDSSVSRSSPHSESRTHDLDLTPRVSLHERFAPSRGSVRDRIGKPIQQNGSFSRSRDVHNDMDSNDRFYRSRQSFSYRSIHHYDYDFDLRDGSSCDDRAMKHSINPTKPLERQERRPSDLLERREVKNVITVNPSEDSSSFTEFNKSGDYERSAVRSSFGEIKIKSLSQIRKERANKSTSDAEQSSERFVQSSNGESPATISQKRKFSPILSGDATQFSSSKRIRLRPEAPVFVPSSSFKSESPSPSPGLDAAGCEQQTRGSSAGGQHSSSAAKQEQAVSRPVAADPVASSALKEQRRELDSTSSLYDVDPLEEELLLTQYDEVDLDYEEDFNEEDLL